MLHMMVGGFVLIHQISTNFSGLLHGKRKRWTLITDIEYIYLFTDVKQIVEFHLNINLRMLAIISISDYHVCDPSSLHRPTPSVLYVKSRSRCAQNRVLLFICQQSPAAGENTHWLQHQLSSKVDPRKFFP